MIHQPYGQVGGQVSDIEIQANEILKERSRLNEILAKHCKQPIETVARETDRDKYYSAQEAKAFGLVDEVLEKPADAVKKNRSPRPIQSPSPAGAPRKPPGPFPYPDTPPARRPIPDGAAGRPEDRPCRSYRSWWRVAAARSGPTTSTAGC